MMHESRRSVDKRTCTVLSVGTGVEAVCAQILQCRGQRHDHTRGVFSLAEGVVRKRYR